MNKKLVLTSMLALVVAGPAMATTTVYLPDFYNNVTRVEPDPENKPGVYEYALREDTLYVGAATKDHMDGVYQDEATVYGVATYTNKCIQCGDGEYLPANSINCAPCPNGYYCASNCLFVASYDQGLTKCPATHPQSQNPANVEQTDCYRPCETRDVPNALVVVGRVFWGPRHNTCEALDCNEGWHLLPTIDGIAPKDLRERYSMNAATTAKMVSISHTGSVGSDMMSFYPYAGADSWGVERNITPYQGTDRRLDLYGEAFCANNAGSNNYYSNDPYKATTAELGAYGGQNCYCRLTAYKDTGRGGGEWTDLYSDWLFAQTITTGCANNCAAKCAELLGQSYTDYRNWQNSILLAATGSKYGTCPANTIYFEWSHATPDGSSETNYSGNIQTPTSNQKPNIQELRGTKFVGWVLKNADNKKEYQVFDQE